MNECASCGNPMERRLVLVKDGTVYEAFQCAHGHHLVVDTHRDHIPIELVALEGASLARVVCGSNCYIFDRRIFRLALRRVLQAARQRPGPLVLDLSEVGFVGEPLLRAVRALDGALARRGFLLYVVAPSMVVFSELAVAAPSLAGRVFGEESEAVEALGLRSPARNVRVEAAGA